MRNLNMVSRKMEHARIERERREQLLYNCDEMQAGEPFAAKDVAYLICTHDPEDLVTCGCRDKMRRTLDDMAGVSKTVKDNKAFYSQKSKNMLSVSWRHDHSLYQELEVMHAT